MATARAIARAVGLGPWLAPLDALGAELASELGEQLATAWRDAVAAAWSALREPPVPPLIAAIATLAEHAAVAAAAQLGDAIRTGAELAPLCAQLLGDPRACESIWRDAAPAVLAALEVS
jgi:hypothetical protein